MKFNKLYESIFKPASKEEVETRKSQSNLEEFKEWIEKYLKIKYEDLFKRENINKQDYDGDTALIEASGRGLKDIVELLLKHNADVNINNKIGCTSLIKAYMHGKKDIADLLKSYGAKE